MSSKFTESEGPLRMPGLLGQPTWIAAMEVPEVVDNFLKKDYYFTHYELLAAYAEQLLNDALATEDMQPFKTTSRAKTDESLREKLTMRYEEKKYKSSEDIKRDVVDLAGVRIILYMPTEKEHKKVEKVIQSIWGKDVKPKLHPEPKKAEVEGNGQDNRATLRRMKYQPRHLGYRAIHYRAPMRKELLELHPHKAHVKYHYREDDLVEIQVVSALTHAWAEVGHDVTYKSYAYGQPTVQEERTLDALNGLVQSGDLLLEQFYEMVDKRTHVRWKHRDEIETYLREVDVLQGQHESEFDSEGLDVLLGFLTKQGRNYPIAIRTALKGLGFPDNPQLENVIARFSPGFDHDDIPAPGMRTVVCLTYIMVQELGGYKSSEVELPSGKQCCIMMSALSFLQRVFGLAELANDYLRRLPMEPEEKTSVDFVLASYKRQIFLFRENSDQDRDKPSLRYAWLWFEKQARNPKSICGLAFQLAEIQFSDRSMKESKVLTLLAGLTIGNYGRLSRSSTISNFDDGDSDDQEPKNDSMFEGSMLHEPNSIHPTELS